MFFDGLVNEHPPDSFSGALQHERIKVTISLLNSSSTGVLVFVKLRHFVEKRWMRKLWKGRKGWLSGLSTLKDDDIDED